MKKTRTSLAAAFLALGVCASIASGGAPMGLPITTLEEGQWSVSGEVAHDTSDMEASGKLTYVFPDIFWKQDFEIEDLASNLFLANVAYGICDNWSVFVRLGAADASDDIVAVPSDGSTVERQGSFDGGYGFAGGIGTRVTFCRWGPWTFGGQAQATWFKPGESDFEIADPILSDDIWVGDAEIEYWQTQISVAAAYQIDTWRFWAGPFLQFIDGDLDFKGVVPGDAGELTWTSDLEESSQFGGHFGANWDMADRWNLWAESQITADSWLVGVGVVFIPEALGQ
ncbi:MAG: hypothetical protein ABFD90_02820 [Phycisphaerales bacterium]